MSVGFFSCDLKDHVHTIACARACASVRLYVVDNYTAHLLLVVESSEL